MKPTIEQLQMEQAGSQAPVAYVQQERDTALKASTADIPCKLESLRRRWH